MRILTNVVFTELLCSDTWFPREVVRRLAIAAAHYARHVVFTLEHSPSFGIRAVHRSIPLFFKLSYISESSNERKF